jgi:uncharacterized membrane protein
MSRKTLFALMAISAVVGLMMSAYLTYLSSTPPTVCPVGDYGVFSCTDVIWSEYAHFYGVSVAMLGLGWFIIALGLIIVAWQNEASVIGMVAWSVLGAVGVTGFVYTEIFLLGSICQLCTITHIAGLTILALSAVSLRDYKLGERAAIGVHRG